MNWWRRAAMTVPASNAWFPLGGQRSTTAHSSITDPSAREALFQAQVAHAQAQMITAQAQVHAQQALDMAQAQAQVMAHLQNAHFCSTAGGLTGVAPITAYSTGTMTVSVANQGFTYASAAPAKSTEAIARSMELLYDWLTPDQRKQLAIHGYFDVIGGDTGIRYRLYPPANYNVHQLVGDTGETEVKLCFEPKDKSLPKGDIWLCQKLALELDERATLEIANRSASYYG